MSVVRRAMKARPPTTLPAMAPVFVWWGCGGGGGGGDGIGD